MNVCQLCGRAISSDAQFCSNCGSESLNEKSDGESLNLHILYGMVGLLILALLCPPWESAPGQSPEYLGMHFILSPPEPDAVVSRILQTIELVTIAVGGMYGAWFFRGKGG
jgi:predicted nucleic acid-binding Zn ribbon protein